MLFDLYEKKRASAIQLYVDEEPHDECIFLNTSYITSLHIFSFIIDDKKKNCVVLHL